MDTDPFWLHNIRILIDTDKLNEFIPTKDLELNRKLNSIVRFCLYLGIILTVLKRNYLYLYIFVFSLILTYLIYTFSDTSESFTNDQIDISNIGRNKCQLPTNQNPFMNVMLTDDTNRKQACDIDNRKVRKLMNKKFKANLFNDIEDVYDRKNSQRQFYTMPSTTIPNNQKTFQNWLYKTPPTCKEGNGNQCVGNLYTPLTNSHTGTSNLST
jgi:hypothetical protein